MTAPVTVRERDLRALAAIVSEDRPDLPDGEGLPPSLLADLRDLIPSDYVTFWGSEHKPHHPAWFVQQNSVRRRRRRGVLAALPGLPADLLPRTRRRVAPSHQVLRLLLAPAMARQRHLPRLLPGSRRRAQAHGLPPRPRRAPSNGTLRLAFSRGTGSDFSERDRAALTLLRPHLHQAYLDAERRRHPVPRLTPRQWELMRLVAVGHTNTQIARRLGISERTVRTHLENIYGRLDVSSRTAAVTRAFPGRVA